MAKANKRHSVLNDVHQVPGFIGSERGGVNRKVYLNRIGHNPFRNDWWFNQCRKASTGSAQTTSFVKWSTIMSS